MTHYFLFQDPDDAFKVYDAILLAQKLTDMTLTRGIGISHMFGREVRASIDTETPEATKMVLTAVSHFKTVCVQTDSDQSANDFLEKRVSIADWSAQDKLEVRYTFQLFLKE